MKLNLLALSLFAGAAVSKGAGHDESCKIVTKLTADLDDTCQYLHEQQILIADSHGSSSAKAYTQRRSAPLTVGEATTIALGCYHHFDVVYDDIIALADERELVVPGFGEKKEELHDKIVELESISSDDEKCKQTANMDELAEIIERLVKKAEEARGKTKSSGMLEECSSSGAIFNGPWYFQREIVDMLAPTPKDFGKTFFGYF